MALLLALHSNKKSSLFTERNVSATASESRGTQASTTVRPATCECRWLMNMANRRLRTVKPMGTARKLNAVVELIVKVVDAMLDGIV